MSERLGVGPRARMRVGASVLAAVAVAVLSTAADHRVVVTTTKGDRVEGLYRGGSEDALRVEVAGQSLSLPVASVAFLTFGPGTSERVAAIGPITDLAGVRERLRPLRTALEVGVLRTEYRGLLQEQLAPVVEFLRTRDATWHPDAQLALEVAIEAYKNPLGPQRGHSPISVDWRAADAYLDYAERTLRLDAPGRREDPAEKTLAFGSEVEGRIGSGDASEALVLGVTTLADVYRLDLPDSASIVPTIEGGPCDLRWEIKNKVGKVVDRGLPGEATGAQLLKRGNYHLVVSCSDGGVGTYKLRIPTPAWFR